MPENEIKIRKYSSYAVVLIAFIIGRDLGFLWGLAMLSISFLIWAPVIAAEEDEEDSTALPSWASAKTLLSEKFRARSAILSSICFVALLAIPYTMNYIDNQNATKELEIAQENGFVSVGQQIAFSDSGFSTMLSFQETGFESLEQAIELRRFGATKDQAIEAASVLSPAEFRACSDVLSTFELACEGKSFSWFITPVTYIDAFSGDAFIKAAIHEEDCKSRVVASTNIMPIGIGVIDDVSPIDYWSRFAAATFNKKIILGLENDQAKCGRVIGQVLRKDSATNAPVMVYETVSIETDAELAQRLELEAELWREDPFDVEGNILHNSKFVTTLFRCVDDDTPNIFNDYYVALFNRAIFFPSYYWNSRSSGHKNKRKWMSDAELAKDNREKKSYSLRMEAGNSIIFSNYIEKILTGQKIGSYSQTEVNYFFRDVRELGAGRKTPGADYIIDRTRALLEIGTSNLICKVVPKPEPVLEQLYRRISDYNLKQYEEAEADFNNQPPLQIAI
jgi:hypothetical protein